MNVIRNAFPYFPEEDIEGILADFKKILKGDGFLTMGENVISFEKEFAEYCGSKYAVATNSCTTALEVSLNTLNLRDGDEVVVPTQTFIATGSCVVRAGARPVFCDVDDNFLMSFEDLKKKVTNRTKAVIIVHFSGLISDEIFKIKEYLKKKEIVLIEDAAHAHGAQFRGVKAGSIGDLGCFSFFSTKNMTTGEGGMITTNNYQYFQQASSIRDRGRDVSRKDELFINIGSNNRMTEIQGILGRYQLKRLDEFVSYRNLIASIYKEELRPALEKSKIRLQDSTSEIVHGYWKFLVFLKDSSKRSSVLNALCEKGISANSPYSPLLHLQPALKKYSIKSPVAEKLCESHISLPIHLKVSEEEAHYVAQALARELND